MTSGQGTRCAPVTPCASAPRATRIATLATLAILAAPAHAEPISTEIVKQFVMTATEPVRDVDPPTPDERATLVASLATPFLYDGLTFGSLDDAGAAAAKRCKKTFKRAGTITSPAKLPAFVDCLQLAMFSGALDGDAEWTRVDLAKLPRVFKKHRAKLTKLAKNDAHTLVLSHFIPAGPAEYFDLWIVKHEPSGALKLSGMLVVNLEDSP